MCVCVCVLVTSATCHVCPRPLTLVRVEASSDGEATTHEATPQVARPALASRPHWNYLQCPCVYYGAYCTIKKKRNSKAMCPVCYVLLPLHALVKGGDVVRVAVGAQHPVPPHEDVAVVVLEELVVHVVVCRRANAQRPQVPGGGRCL